MATIIGVHEGISVYRADKVDKYGNPRIIVNILDFLKPNEGGTASLLYGIALERATKLGYKIDKTGEMCGGFVKSSHEDYRKIANEITSLS